LKSKHFEHERQKPRSGGKIQATSSREPDKAKAALLQKIADEAERGVLCTVDPKQPVPEVLSGKPLNSN
jgi:hypothetical protein